MKILLGLMFSLFIGQASQASDCFLNSGVRGFENNGQNSVIVDTIRGTYQVDTWVCLELDWADEIAFRPWSGMGSRICKNDYLYIIERFSGRIKRRCSIYEITKVED